MFLKRLQIEISSDSQVSGSELAFVVSEVFLKCYLEARAPVQCEGRGVMSKVKVGFIQRD